MKTITLSADEKLIEAAHARGPNTQPWTSYSATGWPNT
jgi:hypothetical protein